MNYKLTYKTPDGFSDMIMSSDGTYLTGLCFEKSGDVCKLPLDGKKMLLSVFVRTCRWLDLYFDGKIPDFTPEWKIEDLTPFRRQVTDIMTRIPYGETVTYGEIAYRIARENGLEKMSAQAVGGAVGWNPICIIIPCHRVVGGGGKLVGYGGGLENKAKLLELEKKNMTSMIIH